MKSMAVKGYKEVSGRYLVTDAEVVDCDSTASLQMCFRNFSFSEANVAQSDKGKKPAFSLFSRLTDILPKGTEAAAREAAEEETQEISN
jgi:hypothetical protein